MFLILNSIAASLDGLIIGIGLKLAKVKISKTNTFIILIINILIYTFFIIIYKYFNLSFMTKTISTLLYLLLAWHSLKEEKENDYQKKLTISECIILATTHSLDGTIISLNFVYNYPSTYIIFIFSFMSIFILLIGYYFANIFENTKKSNCLSCLLFILLAILNYFL